MREADPAAPNGVDLRGFGPTSRLRWSPFAPRKCAVPTYFRGAKADHPPRHFRLLQSRQLVHSARASLDLAGRGNGGENRDTSGLTVRQSLAEGLRGR
jgi:hypothetical protein